MQAEESSAFLSGRFSGDGTEVGEKKAVWEVVSILILFSMALYGRSYKLILQARPWGKTWSRWSSQKWNKALQNSLCMRDIKTETETSLTPKERQGHVNINLFIASLRPFNVVTCY